MCVHMYTHATPLKKAQKMKKKNEETHPPTKMETARPSLSAT